MPTYEYRCTACGHQFEIFQSMSAPDPAACDSCSAEGVLEKVLFPVAVHYKGSGFYSTDYNAKPASSSDAKPSSDSNTTASTSNDA